jgi:hypothetical protein
MKAAPGRHAVKPRDRLIITDLCEQRGIRGRIVNSEMLEYLFCIATEAAHSGNYSQDPANRTINKTFLLSF